jgi:hypothetical protein
MNHPAFISGNFDTRFVEKYFRPNETDQTSLELASFLASKIYHERNHNINFSEKGNLLRRSKWLINK